MSWPSTATPSADGADQRCPYPLDPGTASGPGGPRPARRSMSRTSRRDPRPSIPRPRALSGAAGSHSHRAGRPAAARGRAARRRSLIRRTRGAAVHRQADRAPRDLRRPGGHRHRERPPVQRDEGGARSSRRRRSRDPAGDRELADRPPAGHGGRCRERRPGLRGDGFGDLPSGGRTSCVRSPRHGTLRRALAIGESIPVIATRSAAGRCSTGGRSTSRTSGPPRRSSRNAAPAPSERGSGIRTILATPLLREGTASGVIFVDRRARAPSLLGQADRAPRDVRRPGGHRDRERPPVHGAWDA